MTESSTTEHMAAGLTHLRSDGSAHMVDVTEKAVTKRTARAEAFLETRSDVVDRLMTGELPKGEALGTARIAGIMAAKRTSELIPLCHPLPIQKVAVDFSLEEAECAITVTAMVKTTGQTGVEMEALTAASIALLTVYDMAKALDKAMRIENVRLLEKTGGKSGPYTAPDTTAQTTEA